MLRYIAMLAVVLAPLLPGAARAQATSEVAQDLTTHLTRWIDAVTGTKLSAEDLLLQLLPQGDHYAAFLPLGVPNGGPQATAVVRQRLGLTLIDQIRFPALAHFDPNRPNDVITIGEQTGRFLIDDSAGTASMGHLGLSAIDLRTGDNNHEQILAQVGRLLVSVVLHPTLDGVSDLLIDKHVDSFAVSVAGTSVNPGTLTLGTVDTALSVQGIPGDDAVAAVFLAAVHPPRSATGDRTVPSGSAGFWRAMANLTSGIRLGNRLDHARFSNRRTAVSLMSSRLDLSAGQQNGLLDLDLALEAAGLLVSDTDMGKLAAFVPTRVLIHPSLRNLPVDALIQLAALDDRGASTRPADLEPIFARGGVRAAVEDLAVDVAGATITGTGVMTFESLQAFSGNATLVATNLDALQQKLAPDPALAPALSALIFLKGVGRTEGERMVWDIDFHDQRLTVNNQDFTAMLYSALGRPPPPPRPARRR